MGIGIIHPDADFLLARAAAERGIPHCLSTMSTASMEEMRRAIEGELWFQLYVLKDRSFNEQIVLKAQDLGYAALVVTVDLPAGGKRDKDLKAGISVPLRPSLKTALGTLLHPSWAFRQMRGGLPRFPNVEGLLGDTGAGLTIAARVGQNLNSAFDWDDMKRLRDLWRGPLIVKGVMHTDDAVQLEGLGADAIWVSNHGGRQLDGALASLDAMDAIVRSNRLGVPVILDSGIRRGNDLLKGRALGMALGGIGRAALLGTVHGAPGAGRVLDIILDELRLSMQLAGQPKLSDVKADLLETVAV